MVEKTRKNKNQSKKDKYWEEMGKIKGEVQREREREGGIDRDTEKDIELDRYQTERQKNID